MHRPGRQHHQLSGARAKRATADAIDESAFIRVHEHRAELAAITERFAAALRARLERFTQQQAKSVHQHELVKPALARSADASTEEAPTRRRVKEEALHTRSRFSPLSAPIVPGGGPAPKPRALPHPRAGVPDSPATCPIPLLGADVVLGDPYEHREARRRRSSAEIPTQHGGDVRRNWGQEGAASAVEQSDTRGGTHAGSGNASFSEVPTLPPPQADGGGANTSDMGGFTMHIDAPSAHVDRVASRSASPVETAPGSPQIGVFAPAQEAAPQVPRTSTASGLSMAALVAKAAIRSRQPSLNPAASTAAFGAPDEAEESRRSLGGTSALDRSGLRLSAGQSMSNLSRAPSFGGYDNPAADDSRNPLEIEVERLKGIVNGRLNAVAKMQREATSIGVPRPAVEAAVKGRTIDSFLDGMTIAIREKRARAPSISSMPSPRSERLGTSERRAASPGGALLTPGQLPVTPGGLSALDVPTSHRNGRRRMSAISFASSAGASGSGARPRRGSRISATGKAPPITLTPLTAEAFFDAFVRDANVDELQRAVKELTEAVSGVAPREMTSTLTAVTKQALGEATALLELTEEERGSFAATVKSLERACKRDRREGEAAVERIAKRADAMERQLVLAVRDHLVAAGDLTYPDSEDGDAGNGVVERGEEEVREDGTTIAATAVQCTLEATALEEALRTLRELASKERLVHEGIESMEELVGDIVRHDELLEQELACAHCGTVREEYFALWPCGHAFCSVCVFASQTDIGDFICPTCQNSTTEAPVPNTTANMIAARISFKRLGAQNIVNSVSTFRAAVDRIDDIFKRETDSHYRSVAPEEEFESLRDVQRKARA